MCYDLIVHHKVLRPQGSVCSVGSAGQAEEGFETAWRLPIPRVIRKARTGHEQPNSRNARYRR